jgi:UPF0716 protein FxsA
MIGIPIAEIAVFIEVGERIGLWPTISTIILTAMIGTFLLRQQGLATLQKVQSSLEQNRLPLTEVFDGLCLLVAGVLLLTPGFVTDGFGFLLFFPPFRTLLRHVLARYWTSSGRIDIGTGATTPPPNDGTTIEGDYVEINPAQKPAANDPDQDKSPPQIPK